MSGAPLPGEVELTTESHSGGSAPHRVSRRLPASGVGRGSGVKPAGGSARVELPTRTAAPAVVAPAAGNQEYNNNNNINDGQNENYDAQQRSHSRQRRHRKPRRTAKLDNDGLTARSVSGTQDISKHLAQVREAGRRNVPVYSAVKALHDVRSDRIAMRELKVYLIYLVVLICTIFVGRDLQAHYQFHVSMEDALISARPRFETVTLDRVDTFDDVFQYLDDVFVPGMCQTQWYNGRNKTLLDVGLINNHIRPVGYVQFRQFRVRDDSCEIPSEFDYLEDQCFAQYSTSTEETEPFGIEGDPDRYEWSSGHALEWGAVVLNYGSGGYVVNVPVNRREDLLNGTDGCAELRRTVAQLKSDLWLDRHTSAVRISGLFYNANKNLAAAMRVLIESAPTGNLVKTWSVRSFRISLYFDLEDKVRLAFELVFVAFVVYYCSGMARAWFSDARRHGFWHHLQSGWAIVDLANAAMMISLIIVRVIYILDPVRSDFDTATSDESLALATLATIAEVEIVLNACIIVLAFVRLFRYLRLSDRMSLLWIVLSKASVDLVPFTILFFTLYISYAIFGHIVFGRSVKEWSTFSSAFAMLTRMLIGDIDYPPTVEANRVMAPIFFYSFTLFFFLILVTIFLAIVNDAYSAVQERLRLKDRSARGINVVVHTAFVVRRVWSFLMTTLMCCGLCRRRGTRREKRRRDERLYASSGAAAADGDNSDGGGGENGIGGDDGGVGRSAADEEAGTVPGLDLGHEYLRRREETNLFGEDPDDNISPKEFFLWVSSGRTKYHRSLDLIRTTLEVIALENCGEHGCFLPRDFVPKYVDSPGNGELHACGLCLTMTTTDIVNAISEAHPRAELPTAEILDHVIALANDWIDLDVMSDESIPISAPKVHPSLAGDNNDNGTNQNVGGGSGNRNRDKYGDVGAREHNQDDNGNSKNKGRKGSLPTSETGFSRLEAASFETRLAAMQRQNDELRERLDMVIKLLSQSKRAQD